MSVYTTQVRWIIEGGQTLSLDSYPIFEESYRQQLNQKIIDHFYFREIGFETVGLFNNRLKAKMNEIMPYYNQLYNSTLMEFDPFITQKYLETFQRDATDKGQHADQESREDSGKQNSVFHADRGTVGQETSEESGEQVQKNKVVGSDTPQGLLAMDTIENEVYASTASISQGDEADSRSRTGKTQSDSSEDSHNDTSTESTGKLSRQGTHDLTKWEQFSRSIEGFQGTNLSDALIKFRQTFLNIDMMIIEELETLFMQIW